MKYRLIFRNKNTGEPVKTDTQIAGCWGFLKVGLAITPYIGLDDDEVRAAFRKQVGGYTWDRQTHRQQESWLRSFRTHSLYGLNVSVLDKELLGIEYPMDCNYTVNKGKFFRLMKQKHPKLLDGVEQVSPTRTTHELVFSIDTNKHFAIVYNQLRWLHIFKVRDEYFTNKLDVLKKYGLWDYAFWLITSFHFDEWFTGDARYQLTTGDGSLLRLEDFQKDCIHDIALRNDWNYSVLDTDPKFNLNTRMSCSKPTGSNAIFQQAVGVVHDSGYSTGSRCGFENLSDLQREYA